MSAVPIGSNVVDSFKAGHGQPMSEQMLAKYGEGLKALKDFGMSSKAFSQFGGAELLGKKYDIKREDVDKFGFVSQQRASAATKAGKFKEEIVPVPVKLAKGDSPSAMHTEDEGIRATTLEGVSNLKAMFPNGIMSPATSSQICDGAAAMIICNERGLQKLGVRPKARIHSMALAATDPVIMLEGPVPAAKSALQKGSLKIGDIGLYEVNEAFATVPLAFVKALGADFEKLNVNGGAMALGHPLGGTGAKLMATLLHEMEKRKERFGLLAICEGGGTANATIIERMA